MMEWKGLYLLWSMYYLGVVDGDDSGPRLGPIRLTIFRIAVFLFWPAFLIVHIARTIMKKSEKGAS